MTKLSANPNTVARAAVALAQSHTCSLAQALVTCTKEAGIRSDSYEFDEVARLAGLPYCGALDLYVDLETKRKAEELGFVHAHRALAC
jgi:hypothetical protein